MAISNGATAIDIAHQKVVIEGCQTVVPSNITDPGLTRQVFATDPIGSGIFRASLNLVFLYKKATEEDSGWVVAGWMKESLGWALKDGALLAGRLRRANYSGGDEDGNNSINYYDGEVEIIANGSGARLIEAKIGMNLQDFLDLNQEMRRIVESKLVFWKDVDEQNPQFSPLFYIQVTNFECGGYSIGMSCSFLLADLLITDNFLQKWSKVHKEIISKNDGFKTPFFYLPNLKAPSLSPNDGIMELAPSDISGQTLVLNVSGEGEKSMDLKSLALVCIEEAESKIGRKVESKLSFLVKDPQNKECIKVQSCRRQEHVAEFDQVVAANLISWDGLGLSEVGFYQGNDPILVSGWVGSGLGEGLVMAFGSSASGGGGAASGMNFICHYS